MLKGFGLDFSAVLKFTEQQLMGNLQPADTAVTHIHRYLAASAG